MNQQQSSFLPSQKLPKKTQNLLKNLKGYSTMLNSSSKFWSDPLTNSNFCSCGCDKDLTIEEGDHSLTINWNAPEGGNAIAYNFYSDGVLAMENITDTQITMECDYGFYVFAVEALYENEMTSVKMVKGIDYQDHTSVAENQENVYNIYPNPTNGNITICGEEIDMVEVYNICGQKVMSVKANSNNVNVNMSELTTGVYMVKITDKNGNETVNKVVKR